MERLRAGARSKALVTLVGNLHHSPKPGEARGGSEQVSDRAGAKVR